MIYNTNSHLNKTQTKVSSNYDNSFFFGCKNVITYVELLRLSTQH